MFVGLGTKIGEAWVSLEEAPLLIGGTMIFYSATKLAERVKCGDIDCVWNEYSFNSAPEELRGVMGNMWDELAEIVDMKETADIY